MVDGEFSQHFAVQLDTCQLQTINKTAVSKLMLSAGGIDAQGPELMKVAFLELSSNIGILTGLVGGVGTELYGISAFPAETFGNPVNLLVSGA